MSSVSSIGFPRGELILSGDPGIFHAFESDSRMKALKDCLLTQQESTLVFRQFCTPQDACTLLNEIPEARSLLLSILVISDIKRAAMEFNVPSLLEEDIKEIAQSLEELKASDCKSLTLNNYKITNIQFLSKTWSNLEEVTLQCMDLESLEGLDQCEKLRKVNLDGCISLEKGSANEFLQKLVDKGIEVSLIGMKRTGIQVPEEQVKRDDEPPRPESPKGGPKVIIRA